MNQSSELIQRRRDRLLACLLGLKEREIDPHVTSQVAAKYRKAILDGVNDFVDLVLDVLESVDDGTTVVNELWLQKLDEIHARVVGEDGA